MDVNDGCLRAPTIPKRYDLLFLELGFARQPTTSRVGVVLRLLLARCLPNVSDDGERNGSRSSQQIWRI